MVNIYDKVAYFINIILSEYNEVYLDKIIKGIELSSQKSLILQTRNLDLPFQLEYLFHEIIKEAANQEISLQGLVQLFKASMASAKYQIKTQPSIHPVWTGPNIKQYHSNKTYETVEAMFRNAKNEIFIVGYSFSFYDSSILSLFKEIENAAKRDCRINIIVNKNENNINQILDNWSIDRHKLNVYKWHGGETKYASLHAKLIIIDQLRLLLTSANFSLHGFHKNVETGVVIENHVTIRNIWLQYQALLRDGSVIKVF